MVGPLEGSLTPPWIAFFTFCLLIYNKLFQFNDLIFAWNRYLNIQDINITCQNLGCKKFLIFMDVFQVYFSSFTNIKFCFNYCIFLIKNIEKFWTYCKFKIGDGMVYSCISDIITLLCQIISIILSQVLKWFAFSCFISLFHFHMRQITWQFWVF